MAFTETAVEFFGDEKFLTYTTNDRKYVNKLRKQAEDYPDDVQIVSEFEDGTLVAHLPRKWFVAPKPPVKRAPMSEERKDELRDRLAKMREAQKPALGMGENE